jgi:hypothetical protein
MESRRRNLEREELVDGGWIYFQDGSYSNDQLNSTTATPLRTSQYACFDTLAEILLRISGL